MLAIRGLLKGFGGFVAIRDVDFDLAAGAMHAIIGPNGAGICTTS